MIGAPGVATDHDCSISSSSSRGTGESLSAAVNNRIRG